MALYWLRKFGERKVKEDGKIIFEPLFLCEWCMPSIHSIIGYIFAYSIGILTKLSFSSIVIYPLVVMLSSLTCGLTWSIYNLIVSKTNFYNASIRKTYREIKNIKNANKKNNRQSN